MHVMGIAIYAAAYALIETRTPSSLLFVLAAQQQHAPFVEVEYIEV